MTTFKSPWPVGQDRQTPNLKSQVSEVAVWVLIVAFALTFATLSLRRHAALATNGMDLGNVNQALWNTARGDFLAFTNMAPVRNRLALHVEPILLIFVPFYWVGLGGPRLLLATQAVVVGLGALPLYWLAVSNTKYQRSNIKYPEGTLSQISNPESPTSNLQSLTPNPGSPYSLLPTPYSLLPTPYSLLLVAFPLAYLLLPALEAAVMYDFHAVTLAPTFLLFAFYFVEKDRPWLFALFATLAVACKEDMGLTVAMLGVCAVLARGRWRLGGVTALLGVAWFAVAVFLIQPRFSPVGVNVQAERYAWLGETPLQMVGTLVSRPRLVWNHVWQRANLPAYLGGLLLPTAFLPLLSPLVWLPTLPSFAVNLLSDNPFTWRLEEFHYAAPIAPFVFIAAVHTVRRLTNWVGRRSQIAGRYLLIACCVLVLIASLTYHYGRGFSPLARPYQAWTITDHHRRAQAILEHIPSDAALFAQSNLNPHLSGRRVLYQDPTLLTSGVPEGFSAPDYLLFDVSSLVNQNDFQRFVSSDLVDGDDYGPVVADDGFLLLEKGASEKPLPNEFFDFARADPDDITYSLVADFGDAVRLRGFDLRFNRAEEVQPVLYFEALRPLDEDYFIALYLLDGWAEPLGATSEDQPALVWYPTHRWQKGELVKVTFNTLPWYTRDLPASSKGIGVYRLAVGVVRGRDPWQPAGRLLPSLRHQDESRYAIRLPEDGTLLELARFYQVFGLPAGGPVERGFRRPKIQNPIDVSLERQIRLLGYDMNPIQCDVEGCALDVILYWQAEQKIEVDYTVFLHLVGEDGQIWAQRDTPPDNGAYPTSRWVEGEIVADPMRVVLPIDIPEDTLKVLVGMYHPDTGRRLSVLDGEGHAVDDKIVLGSER